MKTRTYLGILAALVIIGYVVHANKPVPYQEQSLSQTTPQPSPSCKMTATPQLTEGPYYRIGSPLRTNLQEEGIPGEKLSLSGSVFDTNCQVVAGAWIDFWQANGEGMYDHVDINCVAISSQVVMENMFWRLLFQEFIQVEPHTSMLS